jgi:uncharacterized protein
MITVILILLVIQGAIGAFDVFYNHEWVAKLPRQPSASLELKIHGVRAILYAVVFAGLAWYEWHGLFAWFFLGLIAIEILLTLWDFVVEDRTRKLSSQERITHTVLAMNGGAYVGFLCYVMFTDWMAKPSSLQLVDYGWMSWLLSAYAAGVFLSGIRDGIAGFISLPLQANAK